VRRLLLELGDAPVLVDLQHAEARAVGERRRVRGDGDVGVVLEVVLDHVRDVHLVDVVAAEDRHQVGAGVLDQVDVLVDGVGRAPVPLGAELLVEVHLRRRQGDVVVGQERAEAPVALDVLGERLRLVLREDEHPEDAAVDHVVQREVDDAVLAAERHGGLGALPGERVQARALPTGQDHADRLHGTGVHVRQNLLGGRRRREPPAERGGRFGR
jgi:hypothetical protein